MVLKNFFFLKIYLDTPFSLWIFSFYESFLSSLALFVWAVLKDRIKMWKKLQLTDETWGMPGELKRDITPLKSIYVRCMSHLIRNWFCSFLDCMILVIRTRTCCWTWSMVRWWTWRSTLFTFNLENILEVIKFLIWQYFAL